MHRIMLCYDNITAITGYMTPAMYALISRIALALKDDKPEQIKHELIQYSVRTINNSQVSRKTYPRKMHALYEKTSLYESDSAIFGAD